MSAPSFASEPQVQYLHQVLDQVAKGELLIPDFQRPNRWDDDQRRELLRSISHGYPIGALMVWRTTKTLQTATALGDRIPPPVTSVPLHQYLLDGMQRVSTLFAALWSPPRGQSDLPKAPPGKAAKARWHLGYHLDKEEWIFMDDADDDERLFVVPGRILLTSTELLRFQRKIKHPRADDLVERADQIANAIREYKVAILPLVGDSVETAAKTFTLVNRQGTVMSDLDLLHALTWSETFNLRGLLDRAQEQLHDIGWSGFEEKYFLAVLRGALDLDLYNGSAEKVSDGLKKDSGLIDRVVAALRGAAVFLREHCDVLTLDLLPYSYQAVLLADVFYRHPSPSDELKRHLVQWFWWTTAWATFAGISGYRLKGMVKYLRDLADGKPVKWPRKRVDPTPLPDTTLPESARIHALVLHLFRLQGRPEALRRRLEREGPRALVKGISASRSPGSAFLVASDEETAFQQALRDTSSMGELLGGQFGQSRHPVLNDPDLRRAHAITPRAWQLLGVPDIDGFLDERRQTLERIETEFLEALGKPPGCT